MTTPNKGMQFPANGAAINTWDTVSPGGVNTNFTIVDTALGGVAIVNVTGLSGSQVLTSAQYIPPNIEVTGTLTANVTLNVPAGVGGIWSVNNGATGAYALTVGVVGGTSLQVPYNGRSLLISDGTNMAPAMTNLPSPGTSQMVPYTGSTGFLTASVNMLFDGTNLSVGSGTVNGYAGSFGSGGLSVAGSVSGSGFTGLFAAPPITGFTTPNRAQFTQALTPLDALGNSGASFSVNAQLSNVFSVTMTAASTMSVTNGIAGQTINVRIQQDGTGGRVMSWPASFKWPGGTAGVLSTGASQIDLLVATYDGTYWLATLAKSFA